MILLCGLSFSSDFLQFSSFVHLFSSLVHWFCVLLHGFLSFFPGVHLILAAVLQVFIGSLPVFNLFPLLFQWCPSCFPTGKNMETIEGERSKEYEKKVTEK